ncbi:hypothetical protein A1F94_005530 [Pyrenophora tritici-repentis]|nr:hypothetical protein A1F94_005530 [Pyrenophora tritici-repentis]
MQFSTVIAAIAIMASTATAQGVDLENIAAFLRQRGLRTPSEAEPEHPYQQLHLPARLERQGDFPGEEQGELLPDCTGTPANVITSAPSDCLNVSNKFSYEAFCT